MYLTRRQESSELPEQEKTWTSPPHYIIALACVFIVFGSVIVIGCCFKKRKVAESKRREAAEAASETNSVMTNTRPVSRIVSVISNPDLENALNRLACLDEKQVVSSDADSISIASE